MYTVVTPAANKCNPEDTINFSKEKSDTQRFVLIYLLEAAQHATAPRYYRCQQKVQLHTTPSVHKTITDNVHEQVKIINSLT